MVLQWTKVKLNMLKLINFQLTIQRYFTMYS